MTTRLLLVSHAPTSALRTASFPGNEPLDPPLTSLPEASDEIQKLGPWDSALVAPECRAAETAAILRPGVSFAIDPGLRECGYGRWTGRRLGDVEIDEPDAVAAWITQPETNPHGGESITDLLRRVAAWLDERGGIGGRVLAVTHPAVIRAAIIHAIEATPQSFWRINVEPLSLVDLRGHHGRWTLRSLSRLQT